MANTLRVFGIGMLAREGGSAGAAYADGSCEGRGGVVAAIDLMLRLSQPVPQVRTQSTPNRVE